MNGYFDHNATTPLATPAREAWLAAQGARWHNPSGLYREAGDAKRELEDARVAFADRLGVEPERIVFNSGVTEGCNTLLAHEAARADPDALVFVSAIEHPCVREAAVKWFGAARLRELPVDASGRIDPAATAGALASDSPALVCAMAANNETGVLQPWAEVAELCRSHGVRFYCDAAQWIGKHAAAGWGACDWVTVSGHKFGGPKGTGLLVIPADVRHALALQAGGPQEAGHRAGTESLPDLLAMLAALEDRGSRCGPDGGKARDRFEAEVLASIPGTRVIGSEAARLFNTSMLLMPKHPNLKWLTRLSERGFAVSTGSSCSAGRGNPSRVMAAMGLDHDGMGRVLRCSSGPNTTPGDWSGLAAALREVWDSLREGRRAATRIQLGKL